MHTERRICSARCLGSQDRPWPRGTLQCCDEVADLGEVEASLSRRDQLHADYLLIYRRDGSSRAMTADLSETPHGLLPDAGKVLQGQSMRPQRLNDL